jgi:hypothetical protein
MYVNSVNPIKGLFLASLILLLASCSGSTLSVSEALTGTTTDGSTDNSGDGGGSDNGGGSGGSSPTACPTNFVKVPANATLGTAEFCLAKYEMKVAQNNGTAVFDGYNNSVALDVTLYKPESRPDGVPWVRILLADAISECASLGTGYHLSTAKEWQAAALNIESVATNWSGNSVGSGRLNTGHSDNAVDASAVANGYAVTGSNLLSAGSGSDAYVGTGQNNSLAWGSGGEQKRTHTLSNGEVIWDMAGNARDVVDLDGLGSSVNYTGPGSSGFYEPLGSELSSMIFSSTLSGGGTLNINLFKPATAALTNSTNGIGQTYISSGARTLRLVTRGGNFSNSNSPGIFAADFDTAASATSSSFGFRCAKSL